MIGALIPYLNKLHRSCQSSDTIDRLNYQYTASIIAIFALSLAGTQYLGKPIQCWVPAQFTGAWESYAETYCFISGSYYLPIDDYIPDDYSSRSEQVIGYYQWIPIILAFQAFLFYAPSVFWSSFNFRAGINVKGVLTSAGMVKKKFDKESRASQVHLAAQHIQEALEMQKHLNTEKYELLRFGKRSGLYLIGLYIVTKMLYVGNVLFQFILLNAFLGPQYTFWGSGILNDIWNGREWEESGHFPRVTLCDFHVRVLGNIHRWTVQCVLMINMLNEKVFIFLWWWFVLVGVLSVLSLAYYIIALTITDNQKHFIARYLRCSRTLSEEPDHQNERVFTDFWKKFLRPDGVFLLRLIEMNGGDLLVSEIITVLYTRYKSRHSILSGAESVESPIQKE